MAAAHRALGLETGYSRENFAYGAVPSHSAPNSLTMATAARSTFPPPLAGSTPWQSWLALHVDCPAVATAVDRCRAHGLEYTVFGSSAGWLCFYAACTLDLNTVGSVHAPALAAAAAPVVKSYRDVLDPQQPPVSRRTHRYELVKPLVEVAERVAAERWPAAANPPMFHCADMLGAELKRCGLLFLTSVCPPPASTVPCPWSNVLCSTVHRVARYPCMISMLVDESCVLNARCSHCTEVLGSAACGATARPIAGHFAGRLPRHRLL